MGNIDEQVMKAAPSWADGVKAYQTQKMTAPHKDDPTPMPHYVTRRYKSVRVQSLAGVGVFFVRGLGLVCDFAVEDV